MAEEDVTRSAPVGLAVVGASAGGVAALKTFVAALPADLGGPVVVVLHVSSTGSSVLPAILQRAGVLPASAAGDGDALRPGQIYVAPPDCHVLVTLDGLRLWAGPRENGVRPAIDPTMRTAAVGVPTEDPPTATSPSRRTTFTGDHASGDGTRFTCPDCGGGIFETVVGGTTRLRCSVGHAFSPESFATEQGRELERAMWTATRTLDDRVVLLERLVARARTAGHPRAAAGFERQAHDAREHAGVIRASMQRFSDGASTSPEAVSGAEAR